MEMLPRLLSGAQVEGGGGLPDVRDGAQTPE